jgi:methionine synthase II (cobalamin-independent)
MTELEELYKKLEEYNDFDSDQENCEKFLDIVDEILSKNDPSTIPELLKYFDDDSDYSWVLTSIRKAIEHFDQESYINAILCNLDFLVIGAVRWADEIVNSIFNTESDKEYFRQNMHLADKESLLKLFDIMEEESSHHRELIAELRKELLGN